MDNITGELGDVGETARLSGGPWLMIGKKGKLKGFEEETEMVNGGVSCKEFTIKGRVLGFGRG